MICLARKPYIEAHNPALGISLITFQKIAFLIDCGQGVSNPLPSWDHYSFVPLLPQLITDPIVHYCETMPQFHAAPCRFNKANVAPVYK